MPAPKPIADAPRCLARTRSGGECQSPAVNGKRRCRMHGGSKGTGAPKGNTNAFKHGREFVQARTLIMQSTGLSRDQVPADVVLAKVENLKVKRALREAKR